MLYLSKVFLLITLSIYIYFLVNSLSVRLLFDSNRFININKPTHTLLPTSTTENILIMNRKCCFRNEEKKEEEKERER